MRSVTAMYRHFRQCRDEQALETSSLPDRPVDMDVYTPPEGANGEDHVIATGSVLDQEELTYEGAEESFEFLSQRKKKGDARTNVFDCRIGGRPLRLPKPENGEELPDLKQIAQMTGIPYNKLDNKRRSWHRTK